MRMECSKSYIFSEFKLFNLIIFFQAANNLVVLAREEAGAKFILEQNGIAKLKQLLEERDGDMLQAGLRTLSCLSQNSKQRVSYYTKPKILKGY